MLHLERYHCRPRTCLCYNYMKAHTEVWCKGHPGIMLVPYGVNCGTMLETFWLYCNVALGVSVAGWWRNDEHKVQDMALCKGLYGSWYVVTIWWPGSLCSARLLSCAGTGPSGSTSLTACSNISFLVSSKSIYVSSDDFRNFLETFGNIKQRRKWVGNPYMRTYAPPI